MPDFVQHGLITTLHDVGTQHREQLESLLDHATHDYQVGLVLPVTAADMRAEPFGRIIAQLSDVHYVDQIVVTLGAAPNQVDYDQTRQAVEPLGDRARVLWTDGPRLQALYQTLLDAGLNVAVPGKGRSVWTAFGYLLADPRLKAFALHDCDIVNYDRLMLARLCLPMAHPGMDFEFCKAYYARVTDRMHGRVVRLLVRPLLQALMAMLGENRFLVYLDSFRYPLSGEFAVTSNLARSNRIPSDWGLEVGTLAEVFRNTSLKRVCQVDLCHQYEHKHQALSAEDPSQGLMKMATDILTTIFRTLASMGTVLQSGYFVTLQSAFLRSAQDAIRQYHADAVLNGLQYDRHEEESAVEGFSQQITVAGDTWRDNPLGGEAIPNWSRVLTAFPDFPQQLRQAAIADAAERPSMPEGR
jgi:glucosyl-3-phosphoglycerate synthase